MDSKFDLLCDYWFYFISKYFMLKIVKFNKRSFKEGFFKEIIVLD